MRALKFGGRDAEEAALPRVQCEHCKGSGQDPKKRKRDCPVCFGRGEHAERCAACGEIRFCSCETEPGSLIQLQHDTFHRVKELMNPSGSWTLFIAGPRVQNWGFKESFDSPVIPWQEFIEAKGLEAVDFDGKD